MRLLLINRGGRLEVQTFFPVGGAYPTGIYVNPGEVVMIDTKSDSQTPLELAREKMPDA